MTKLNAKKINCGLIAAIVLSLADEAIILTIIIIVLSQFGIELPLWALATLILFFLAITLIAYRALRKNPQLGFENMIGQSGFAVESVARNGTVRIGRELWFAATKDEIIEVGAEIMVVEQTGLKLTVIRKN